jgi:hypothetical protein
MHRSPHPSAHQPQPQSVLQLIRLWLLSFRLLCHQQSHQHWQPQSALDFRTLLCLSPQQPLQQLPQLFRVFQDCAPFDLKMHSCDSQFHRNLSLAPTLVSSPLSMP